jgi:DNA-binding HxlR family transcriptional regulator
VPGISTKVLAKELKDLEAYQFIARTVHFAPPVVVDYYVLPYARTLDLVMEVLNAWGMQHQQRVAKLHAAPVATPV